MSVPAGSGPLAALSAAGVSVWLDDLSRELLAGGELEKLITDKHVVGVTTNPTIFASALSKGDRYNQQLRRLGDEGSNVDDAVFALTTEDVRNGCDAFRAVHERTGGVDGRVSIEVDPRLAQDADATAALARKLWDAVDRPNLFIKIPATRKGLKAITAVVAEGISVNVTLIFSLDRYREVMDAYQTGLELAQAAGRDLADIHSVASFFVSRVDSEVDRRLEALGMSELKGRAAIANARLAHQASGQMLAQPRWQRLASAGARVQRPLWASTGVKDPSYPDTMYVSELVIPGTVNTMPAATLDAFADHGILPAHAPTEEDFAAAAAHLEQLQHVGVDFTDVTETLEREGLTKFEVSWAELGASVQREMHPETGPADAGGGDDGHSESAALLATYLDDHYTGATGGLELFRRAAEARTDAEGRAALTDLAQQVDEDRESLARIMADLDLPRSQSKAAIGWLAEKAGRLKTNGHLFTRSPLSDVLEAESMLLGVLGKAACWRTLRVLAESDARLCADDLDVLLDRAEQQSATLEELRSTAAVRALLPQPSHTR
ncbi:hypothetical protein GCM10010331_18170 [Streptomyces xanthochromogenes]|nr:hypothetical protein GCM10010331_18170 [Streptomyces xanthochromogenes]